MNALTAEWVEKAEGDYAEKYLKAFLQEHGMAFPKTHNLIELLELCLPLDSSFEIQRDRLVQLDRYAVHYRYPGESADKGEARLALRTIRAVRSFLQKKLGISS